MSSALWDWVAILTDLRSAEGVFVPLYWTIPARLFLWCGATPPLPETILLILVALSIACVGYFVWKRKRVGLYLACAIWGALFADTPYILHIPPLLILIWKLPLAIARLFGYFPTWRPHHLRWRMCVLFFSLGLLLAGFVNFARFGMSYPGGYCRRAIAVLRWDGLCWSQNTSHMDELLDAYVKELAREGAGHTWIFTDGLCDSGIELAAEGRLRAVSLDVGRLDAEVARREGFTRREDLFALEGGATQLLRAWALDRPAELTNAVFQCGSSFFEQFAPNRVEPYGLVLRSVACGKMPHQRGGGIPAAPSADLPVLIETVVWKLGERIVSFWESGGSEVGVGRARSIRFGAMQWRVARAIRRSVRILDRAGRTEEARRAVALSDRLDELNPFARARMGETERADRRAFHSLSPREGLAIALKRADFFLARRYAKPILEDDPNNPAANFALAMGHFQLKEYALARDFFEKALEARPDDPAILNNLAMTLLALGELDAAERYVRVALKLSPDSSAIENTLRQIERVRSSEKRR